jgi:hypothetical protein
MSEPIDWRELHWPHPLESDQLLALLTRLAAEPRRRPLVFEARARRGQVRYLLGGSDVALKRTTRLIEELLPGTSVSSGNEPRTPLIRGARLQVKQQAISLDTSTPLTNTRVLLEALAAARRDGEETALQVVLGPGIWPQVPRGKMNDPSTTWLDLLLRGNRPAMPSTQADIRAKHGQFGFRAIVRVGAVASSEAARRSLMLGLQSAVGTLRAAGNRVHLVRDFDGALDEARAPLSWPTRLTTAEIAALLVPPIGKESLPGLPSPHPRLLGSGPGFRPISDSFAMSTAPGTSVNLGADITSRLQHTVFLGGTGSGKSTAMLHLIKADIAAGRSVVVLDPKADLVSDVLTQIPPHRLDDVVVYDPTQTHAVVGLNPLVSPGSSVELTADSILSIFKELWPSAFGGRTTDLLHSSLLTLAHHGKSSLVSLPRLLTDPAFRRTLTSKLDDPVGLGPFWAQFDALSPGQQATAIAPGMSRLRQLLLRPSLRAMLGQVEPKFQLGDVFTKPRIVLVALNKGVLGPEAAKLLGSLVVSQLWQLTLARATTPKANRQPVSLYVDELQDYLHLPTDLADALSQSRSLGVAWHLAHQYRAQVPTDLLAAIDANVRNQVVFRLDAADAAALAKRAPGLEAIDFESMPTYEIYTRLMNAGEQTGWISGRTLPPPKAISDELDIRARSQARYGSVPTPADLGVAETSTDASAEEPIGRKRRGDS